MIIKVKATETVVVYASSNGIGRSFDNTPIASKCLSLLIPSDRNACARVLDESRRKSETTTQIVYFGDTH